MHRSVPLLFAALSTAIASAQGLKLEPVGSHLTGLFDQAAAEIVAFDPATRRMFVVNGGLKTLDVIDASNPSALARVTRLTIPQGLGSSPNSVTVRDGIVAVAVEASPKTDPGYVVFFRANGDFVKGVQVGALPDMLAFSPDGTKVLTANEGEPSDNYAIDPPGSVSIIDISGGIENLSAANVTTVGFEQFNGTQLDPSVRVFGPRATVAQDLEPEYVAFSADGKLAYVTLQEANAIAVLDIEAQRFVKIMGLGFKDHSKPGNGLDASDRDNKIDIRSWPIFGLYQPDTIATFVSGGKQYLITANEGDTRGWTGFNEEARVSTLNLDATAFPNAAELKRNENLGRLTVTNATGDTDGDGDFDRLYVFGGRSFTIWSEDGQVVFDSGDQFEKIMAEKFPQFFNSDAGGGLDTRSDNKGPEPEGLVLAELGGKRIAFIGLERMSGVMAYDITDPTKPVFIDYFHNRKFEGSASAGTGGDHGPEGLAFVPGSQTPTGDPWLLVGNEVSGSTTLYKITPPAAALQAVATPGTLTTMSREVILDASASTGNIVSYSWRIVGRGAGLSLRDPSGSKAGVQFSSGHGPYQVELTVTDAAGNTSTTTSNIFYAGF